MLVARRDDHAAAAAQESRVETARAQMIEWRKVGEHKPVEVDVEMSEDESRALKRSRVTALTIGGADRRTS